MRSDGRPSSRSPARFTSRRRLSPSKAKMATSISSITLRSSVVASSAPRRWARSVAPMAFTCAITSPKRVFVRRSAARANGIVALAHGFEQIGERPQRRRHALPHRCRAAPPDQHDHHGQGPLHLARMSAPVHSRISATTTAGNPAPSASSSMRCSCTGRRFSSPASVLSASAFDLTNRSAPDAGTARCGSSPARSRRGSHCRYSAPELS